MISYVSILQTHNKPYIDEALFRKWLDDKDVTWWNEKYGLSPTGQYEDDDEAKVKSFISKKIDQYNMRNILTSDGDVGCLLALTQMIIEYAEEHGAETVLTQELHSSDHIIIIR
jgi:hypothetical protein